MTSCKEVKKLIDQAEKPDLLAFEVTEHINRCNDCERFASERSELRKLLASGVRVSAPINFDAVLNARLAEVKARRSLSWLGAPGYLRLGAATAGVAVMVVAAQYAGLFSREAKLAPQPQNAKVESAVPSPHKTTVPDVIPAAPVTNEQQKVRAGIRIRRRDVVIGSRIAGAGVLNAEEGGVVIVRGQNGDMDIQMPTVSLGAQPLLYVSAGRRAPPSTGTSF